MEVQIYNRNKAMVVTLVVHLSIVLLMLLSFRSCVRMDDIQTSSGGVEVSFGEPNMGGDDAISESSSDQSEDPVVEPDPSPASTDTDPVVTNEHSEATVKKTQKKKTEKKQPEIDSRLKKSLKNLGKKKNSDKDKNSGPGEIKGPGGDPEAENKGPGGDGRGKHGSGWGMSLAGFGYEGIETPENKSQKFGTVVLEICVDRNGKLLGTPSVSPNSTTLDTYLIRITKDAIRNVKFTPTGNVKNTNCGNFTVKYEKH